MHTALTTCTAIRVRNFSLIIYSLSIYDTCTLTVHQHLLLAITQLIIYTEYHLGFSFLQRVINQVTDKLITLFTSYHSFTTLF